MMQVHVAGRLVRDPEAKTSKNGKDYVQALVLVSAGDADVLVTAMAFDPELQALLASLKKGDSLSACGTGSIRAYLNKEGEPAAGVTLMTNRLMAVTEAKAAAKTKGDKTGNGQRRSEGQYSAEITTPDSELPPIEAYDESIPY